MQTLDYLCIFAYMAGIVAFGAYLRRQKDTSDFFVAGRNLPWIVVSISIMASMLSAISVVSIPGEAFKHGLSLSIGVLVTPVALLFVAFFMLKHFYGLRSYSAYEYLEHRFNLAVRCVGAGMFLLSRVMYLGMVLYASAKAFVPVLQWPLEMIILLTGAIAIVYTLMGGMKAVIWTDLVQFSIIMVGIGTVSVLLIRDVPGGMVGIFQYAFANERGWTAFRDTSFYRFDLFSADFYKARLNLWVLLLLPLVSQLTNFGSDQMSLQRTFSTRSLQDAKKAMAWNVVWNTVLTSLLWFVGIGMFAYYGHFPDRLAAGTEPDRVLSYFMVHALPAGLTGLLFAALLAAIMSTMDSGIHSLSTVTVADFLRRLNWGRRTEAKDLAFARALTGIWGIFAIGMALVIAVLSEKAGATIIEALHIWLSTNEFLLAMFLLGMFSRRTTSEGVVVGVVGGLAVWAFVVFGLYYGQPESKRISFLWVNMIAFIAPVVLGYAASCLQRAFRSKHCKRC